MKKGKVSPDQRIKGITFILFLFLLTHSTAHSQSPLKIPIYLKNKEMWVEVAIQRDSPHIENPVEKIDGGFETHRMLIGDFVTNAVHLGSAIMTLNFFIIKELLTISEGWKGKMGQYSLVDPLVYGSL